ncbi:unnamed protein product [Somion occarium]|uniref:UBX domain-containing protein n=1 Tax=Somion occarium TaxID=3059160 RepID=A0ABP1E943_9APHY
MSSPAEHQSASEPTSSVSPAQAIQSPSAQPEKPSFRVYRPPQASTTSPRELPEDYFTPSAADLKAAQASLSARTQALVNAPLRNRAVREAEETAKRAKYPTTTIRVRFPDRTQLEKTFPSTDKIKSVYAFVRECLLEDVKPIKFVIYQTPPKRELRVSDPNVRDLSLFDLHLAPSSVLHLKFMEDSLNHVDVPAPLDASVLALAEELPIPPDPESTSPPASSSSTPSARPVGSSSSSSTSSGPVKVPKWLKLGHGKK